MLDLLNSKFIFRISDERTAHRSVLMVGKQQTLQTQDSRSYSSNTMRDGVRMTGPFTPKRRLSYLLLYLYTK